VLNFVYVSRFRGSLGSLRGRRKVAAWWGREGVKVWIWSIGQCRILPFIPQAKHYRRGGSTLVNDGPSGRRTDKSGPPAALAAKKWMASCDFTGRCQANQIQTHQGKAPATSRLPWEAARQAQGSATCRAIEILAIPSSTLSLSALSWSAAINFATVLDVSNRRRVSTMTPAIGARSYFPKLYQSTRALGFKLIHYRPAAGEERASIVVIYAPGPASHVMPDIRRTFFKW
jgi:hypothetical protein